MELSYSSSSPLTIARPNHNLSRPQTQKLTRKSSNISTICSPASPSLRFHGHNRRFSSKNIPVNRYDKLNYIRQACINGRSDAIVTKRGCSFGEACWRFVRPYTVQAIAVASSCLLGRAMIESPSLIEWSLVLKALSGLFILVCGHSFVAGINQIYDIDIDKINKPYLPIAAGDLSVNSAWLLVLFFAVAGLSVVGLTGGPVLTGLYILGLLVGVAYSVPPLRLKSFPFGTMLTNAMLWGFLLNVGVFYALRGALGLTWSTPMVYITSFGILTGLVTAIVKDISDVEGDRKNGISTLAITIGARNVAYLGCGLFLVYYAAAILAAIYMPQTFNRNVMIPAHLVLALSLIYQTRVLEQANYTKEASLKFYMVICGLFCAEYLMFPFI